MNHRIDFERARNLYDDVVVLGIDRKPVLVNDGDRQHRAVTVIQHHHQQLAVNGTRFTRKIPFDQGFTVFTDTNALVAFSLDQATIETRQADRRDEFGPVVAGRGNGRDGRDADEDRGSCEPEAGVAERLEFLIRGGDLSFAESTLDEARRWQLELFKKLPKDPNHPLFKLFPDFVEQLKTL